MSHSKNTTIIEEIGVFFQKSTNNAMQRILDVQNGIKMNDRVLGLHTECNARRNTSDKVVLLTLFPFFGVKNPNGYSHLPSMTGSSCSTPTFPYTGRRAKTAITA